METLNCTNCSSVLTSDAKIHRISPTSFLSNIPTSGQEIRIQEILSELFLYNPSVEVEVGFCKGCSNSLAIIYAFKEFLREQRIPIDFISLIVNICKFRKKFSPNLNIYGMDATTQTEEFDVLNLNNFNEDEKDQMEIQDPLSFLPLQMVDIDKDKLVIPIGRQGADHDEEQGVVDDSIKIDLDLGSVDGDGDDDWQPESPPFNSNDKIVELEKGCNVHVMVTRKRKRKFLETNINPEDYDEEEVDPIMEFNVKNNYNKNGSLQCNFCDTTYEDEYLLKEHTKIHVRDQHKKPLINYSSFVNSATQELGILNRHKDYPFGERILLESKYQDSYCEICDHYFKISSYLPQHNAVMHSGGGTGNGNTKIKIIRDCYKCGKSFHTKLALVIHLKGCSSRGDAIKCYICKEIVELQLAFKHFQQHS